MAPLSLYYIFLLLFFALFISFFCLCHITFTYILHTHQTLISIIPHKNLSSKSSLFIYLYLSHYSYLWTQLKYHSRRERKTHTKDSNLLKSSPLLLLRVLSLLWGFALHKKNWIFFWKSKPLLPADLVLSGFLAVR